MVDSLSTLRIDGSQGFYDASFALNDPLYSGLDSGYPDWRSVGPVWRLTAYWIGQQQLISLLSYADLIRARVEEERFHHSSTYLSHQCIGLIPPEESPKELKKKRNPETFPLSHRGTFCSMRAREIFCFPPCPVRLRIRSV
jgi:hypothetical protein